MDSLPQGAIKYYLSSTLPVTGINYQIGKCFTIEVTNYAASVLTQTSFSTPLEQKLQKLCYPSPFLKIQVKKTGTEGTCNYCIPTGYEWYFVLVSKNDENDLYLALFPNPQGIPKDLLPKLYSLDNALDLHLIARLPKDVSTTTDAYKIIYSTQAINYWLDEILLKTSQLNCVAYYYVKDGYPNFQQVCSTLYPHFNFQIKGLTCYVPELMENLTYKEAIAAKYANICRFDSLLSNIYDGIYTSLSPDPLARLIMFVPVIAAFTKVFKDKLFAEQGYTGYLVAFAITTLFALVFGSLQKNLPADVFYTLLGFFTLILYLELENQNTDAAILATRISLLIYIILLLLTKSDIILLPSIIIQFLSSFGGAFSIFTPSLAIALATTALIVGAIISSGGVLAYLPIGIGLPILFILFLILAGSTIALNVFAATGEIPAWLVAIKNVTQTLLGTMLSTASSILSFLLTSFSHALLFILFIYFIYLAVVEILIRAPPLYTSKMALSFFLGFLITSLATDLLQGSEKVLSVFADVLVIALIFVGSLYLGSAHPAITLVLGIFGILYGLLVGVGLIRRYLKEGATEENIVEALPPVASIVLGLALIGWGLSTNTLVTSSSVQISMPFLNQILGAISFVSQSAPNVCMLGLITLLPFALITAYVVGLLRNIAANIALSLVVPAIHLGIVYFICGAGSVLLFSILDGFVLIALWALYVFA